MGRNVISRNILTHNIQKSKAESSNLLIPDSHTLNSRTHNNGGMVML